ncbi:MAG: GerAB/ArcD/ProY family transporter [Lachnospiraceae bacterium]|nr:GerAB/ArcD/ProY family transporter [Lachnospiraceae bacterium]
MFSDNDKISTRQIFRLFVFDFIGQSTLVLPAKLAAVSGNDGLFSILIGGGLASLYLLYLMRVLRGMDMDLLSFMRQSLPVWVEKTVTFFLIFHFIWMAGYGAYMFSDVMQRSLIRGESYTLILALVLAVAGYAVSGGIESRARIYEVLFVVLFVLLFVMFLVAARDMDMDYLRGFFRAKPAAVAGGSLPVFFCLSPIFLFLFFPAYVKKDNWKKMGYAAAGALWFAVFVIAVLYVILVGTFGSTALSTMRYPAVTLMSSIHLKGSFLKRLDAFMIGIWFFTLFAFVSVFLFYGKELLQKPGKCDGKPAGKKAGLILWGLTFVVAELFRYGEWKGFFINYLCCVAGPLLLVLPAALLVIGKCRKNRRAV